MNPKPFRFSTYSTQLVFAIPLIKSSHSHSISPRIHQTKIPGAPGRNGRREGSNTLRIANPVVHHQHLPSPSLTIPQTQK